LLVLLLLIKVNILCHGLAANRVSLVSAEIDEAFVSHHLGIQDGRLLVGLRKKLFVVLSSVIN
jgi:hypothetical protein